MLGLGRAGHAPVQKMKGNQAQAADDRKHRAQKAFVPEDEVSENDAEQAGDKHKARC